jgi:hypothetical protein
VAEATVVVLLLQHLEPQTLAVAEVADFVVVAVTVVGLAALASFMFVSRYKEKPCRNILHN